MLETIDNWRLSKKLLAAFGLIGAFLLALMATGIVTNQQLGAISARHVERGIAGTRLLGQVISQLREHRIIIWTEAASGDSGRMAALDERMRKSQALLAEAVAGYEPLAGAFARQLEELRESIVSLNEVNGRIDAAQRIGNGQAMVLVTGEGKQASERAIALAERLLELHQARSAEGDLEARAHVSNALYFTVALSILAVAALFLVWRLIGKRVAEPMARLATVTTTLAEGGAAEVPSRNRADELGQIARAVEHFRQAAVDRTEADARSAAEQKAVVETVGSHLSSLAGGDLTADISAQFPPAYGELKTNFNEALANLRELIGAVIESTATIQTGSTEIAQASENLARRTESNAASLEETSAAVSQMDGRLKATAEAAERTVGRADQAIEVVGSGRSIADEAVQAMGRVSDSAKGIDSVIEGLDKIAFQTRVLAMNAAVEAGRAGEAGRGFAVVADLVSALAMRAEEEAGRAREQLTVTQTDIIAAVDAVQKVDGALINISGDVGEVHRLLAQMAADNQAQSSAITQISAAIGSMDQATQQNAAMVEETSAAAGNLSGEVGALSERASMFSIGKSQAPARKPAVRKPVAAAPASVAYVSPVKALQTASANGMAAEAWNDF